MEHTCLHHPFIYEDPNFFSIGSIHLYTNYSSSTRKSIESKEGFGAILSTIAVILLHCAFSIRKFAQSFITSASFLFSAMARGTGRFFAAGAIMTTTVGLTGVSCANLNTASAQETPIDDVVVDMIDDGRLNFHDSTGFTSSPAPLDDGKSARVVIVPGIQSPRSSLPETVDVLEAALTKHFPTADFHGFRNPTPLDLRDEMTRALCELDGLGVFGNALEWRCSVEFDIATRITDFMSALSQILFVQPTVFDEDWPAAIQLADDLTRLFDNEDAPILIVAHSGGALLTRAALERMRTDQYAERRFNSIGAVLVGAPLKPADFPLPESQIAFVATCNDLVSLLSTTRIYVADQNNEISGRHEAFQVARNIGGVETGIIDRDCANNPDPDFAGLLNVIKTHSLLKNYSQGALGQQLRDGVANVLANLKRPKETFEVGDNTYTIDRLNLRTAPGVAPNTVITTLPAGVEFVVRAVDANADGYSWRYGCAGALCGYVASSWLKFPNTSSYIPPTADVLPPIYPIVVPLEQAEAGVFYADYLKYGELLDGTGALTACGPDCARAPTPVSIASATLVCRGAQLELDAIVEAGSGARTYDWFVDGEKVATDVRATEVSVPIEGRPNARVIIHVKGKNGSSSRNSSNAYELIVPPCGNLPPAPSAMGPLPSALTLDPTAISVSRAIIGGVASTNGQCTSLTLEWGSTPSYGNATNPFAIGCSVENYNFSREIVIACGGSTVYYEFVAQNSNGTVRGGRMSFKTPR